jgi:predicted MFS family arabinose efflux permease
MATLSRRRHTAFVGLLFAAMGAATMAAGVIGVLATFIIDDFAISRGTLGWIVSANVVVAAAFSPFAGSLTDRMGGRRSLVFVFGTSTVAFVVLGTAPAISVMFVGSALAAFAQAAGNPSTNKLIGEYLPRGERGVVTGIKQSGVQAGITIAGVTLPAVAIAMGWRAAMVVVAVVPLVAGILTLFVVPGDGASAGRAASGRAVLPPSIRWLALYGAIFGFAGAVSFYVPLFAEESLGLDPRLGGLAVAVAGAVAFVARIGWARFAEQRHSFRGPLATMAMIGVAAGASMLASTVVPALLWIGAVLTGMGTSAWNSVGMLAVIEDAGESTGRASGMVLLGFLAGLGIGPPVYGALVDRTGGYEPMWLLSIAASLVALAIVAAWQRASRRAGRPEAVR